MNPQIVGLFSNPTFWQQAKFVFLVPSDEKTKDERGNTVSSVDEVEILFKMKGLKKGDVSTQLESGSKLIEFYLARVIYCTPSELMRKITPGAIAQGVLNGRNCECRIKSISQGSVMAITNFLGQKYTLEIEYRTRFGSAA